MSGNNFVLDSNAIIYASNGTLDVEKLVSEYNRYYISILSYIDVYGFNFEHQEEKKAIDDILKNIEIVNLNMEIADQAVNYRRNPAKKIKLPDAVILATANYLAADLLTKNIRDFQEIDFSVSVVSLDDFRLYN